MGIIRGPQPQDNFVMIDRAWIRDPRLSARSKGILAYILSHAEGYVLTTDQMEREMADGRDSLRTGIRELETAGYLQRVRRRGTDGRVGAYDYRVTAPVDVPAAPAPRNQSPRVASPVRPSRTGADQHEHKVSAGQDLRRPSRTGADQHEHKVSAGRDQCGFTNAVNPLTKKRTREETKEETTKEDFGTRPPTEQAPRAYSANELASASSMTHEWPYRNHPDSSLIDRTGDTRNAPGPAANPMERTP